MNQIKVSKVFFLSRSFQPGQVRKVLKAFGVNTVGTPEKAAGSLSAESPRTSFTEMIPPRKRLRHCDLKRTSLVQASWPCQVSEQVPVELQGSSEEPKAKKQKLGSCESLTQTSRLLTKADGEGEPGSPRA